MVDLKISNLIILDGMMPEKKTSFNSKIHLNFKKNILKNDYKLLMVEFTYKKRIIIGILYFLVFKNDIFMAS